jgi:lipopolysaccharide biosynthesis protein
LANPRLIAFYLPQYHVIKENEMWWGTNFTDWTNVKKAVPLFKSHYQPRIPDNDNYYDLSDPRVMLQQADLAMNFGIDAFCYYHYWFNGKVLLEKPMENMLRQAGIKIPFCMSWANEPWTRAWDGRKGQVLIEQSYGEEQEWRSHFEYLLPFFKDSRYIKIDNKPLFAIYKTNSIPKRNDMFNLWNGLSLKNGFAGIYLAETLSGFQKHPCVYGSSAIIEFEPNYTLKYDMPFIFLLKKAFDKLLVKLTTRYVRKVDYRVVCCRSMRRNVVFEGRKTFLGCYTGWDNTPRKQNIGSVHVNSSPSMFKAFLHEQIQKARRANSQFVFINAWNEWAEGAYLEPDKRNGTLYLQMIKELTTAEK